MVTTVKKTSVRSKIKRWVFACIGKNICGSKLGVIQYDLVSRQRVYVMRT